MAAPPATVEQRLMTLEKRMAIVASFSQKLAQIQVQANATTTAINGLVTQDEARQIKELVNETADLIAELPAVSAKTT